MISRTDILKKADECVTGSRAQDYGEVENNFATIAALWEPYLRAKCLEGEYNLCIAPEDVAMLLALMKIARITSGRYHEDNFVDIAGYAACAGEIAANEEHKEPVIPKTDGPRINFHRYGWPITYYDQTLARILKKRLEMEDTNEP